MKKYFIYIFLLFFSNITLHSKNNVDCIFNSSTQVKNIVILSPHQLVTGGAEALAQLFSELQKHDFPTKIFWVTNDGINIKKTYKNNTWYLCGQNIDLAPSVYKEKYDTNFLNFDIPLDQSTLIIMPEIWGNMIPFFNDAQIGFYWLSIDYFYNPTSKDYRLLLFEKKSDPYNCIHLSDAPWISKKLLSWGIKSYPLEAPISSHYFTTPQTKNKVKNTIAYNPAKGIQLAQAFISQHAEYQYIPLRNLNQLEIINALDEAQIYIDFGHFPGKDRIPREALTRNCIIFIHDAGCASDFESFPIDNFFRFSDTDIIDGTLNNKISYALLNYEETLDKQILFKNLIRKESEKFQEQVKTLIACLTDKHNNE